jgi:Tfp pilus assembly protein PilF
MRRERLAAAREHLALALRTGDLRQRATALNNLGILHMRAGRATQGLQAFHQARATLPGDPESYLNLARWHHQAGDEESARAALDDGLRRAYPLAPLDEARRRLERGLGP